MDVSGDLASFEYTHSYVTSTVAPLAPAPDEVDTPTAAPRKLDTSGADDTVLTTEAKDFPLSVESGRHTLSLLNSPHVPVSQNNEASSNGSGNKWLRLKGAIYPGMDVFDSAIVAGHTTRNRTKDASVRNETVLNSQSMEGDEWQWNSKMSISKRKNDIYDSTSDFEDNPVSALSRVQSVRASLTRLASSQTNRNPDGQHGEATSIPVQLLPSKFNQDHPMLNLRIEHVHSKDPERYPASNTTLWAASFDRYGVPLGHLFSSGLYAHASTISSILDHDKPSKIFLPRFAYFLSKALVHPIFQGDISCLRYTLQYAVYLRCTKQAPSETHSTLLEEPSIDNSKVAGGADNTSSIARLGIFILAGMVRDDTPSDTGWGQFLLQECDIQLLLETLGTLPGRFLSVEAYFTGWMEKSDKVRTQVESKLGDLLTVWSSDNENVMSQTPGKLEVPNLLLETSCRHSNRKGQGGHRVEPEGLLVAPRGLESLLASHHGEDSKSDEKSNIPLVQGLVTEEDAMSADSVINGQADHDNNKLVTSVTAPTELFSIQARVLRPRVSRTAGMLLPKAAQLPTSGSQVSDSRNRKSGVKGRGPGRWAKGTKKSDYSNAQSGPGLPPSWGGKQHLAAESRRAPAKPDSADRGERGERGSVGFDNKQVLDVHVEADSKSLGAERRTFIRFSQPDDGGQEIAKMAPTSCTRCQRMHKGCDRSHPMCARCARANEKCIYTADAIKSDPGGSKQQVAQNSTVGFVDHMIAPVIGTGMQRQSSRKRSFTVEPQKREVKSGTVEMCDVETSTGTANSTIPIDQDVLENHDRLASSDTRMMRCNSYESEQGETTNLGFCWDDAGHDETTDDVGDFSVATEEIAEGKDLNDKMMNELEIPVLEHRDTDAEQGRRSRSSSIASFTFVSSSEDDELPDRSVPSHWYGDFPRRGLPREDRDC